jgi:hypothetical protein
MGETDHSKVFSTEDNTAMAALSRRFHRYAGVLGSFEIKFVIFGEFITVNLPENLSTVTSNNLQNCNYRTYTLV